MAEIVLQDLSKSFGAQEVVRSVNLSIKSREFVALVGPSGCGKTTTLRMLAGLETITGGEIRIAGKRVNELAAKDRDIAMVFQNYALFPHFTVYENLAFGMRLRGAGKSEIDRRIGEAGQLLNITEFLQRKPGQLSGGQRQRVAMGRALVRDPKVFLFDEPLSNLDAKLRIKMRTEIKKLHRRVPTTFVYVTHDQVEAMTLADRIVVMNAGAIEQVGTPAELYERPATRFVAGFIGSPAMNFLPCVIERSADAYTVRLDGGLVLPLPNRIGRLIGAYIGSEIILGIRPEHLTEKRAHVTETQADFAWATEMIEPMGNDTMVYLNLAGTEICARASPHAVARVGEKMEFTVDMGRVHLIDPATDRVIETAGEPSRPAA